MVLTFDTKSKYQFVQHPRPRDASAAWLRTNGVNANGAAAEFMNFDSLGEKGTPWHSWEDKSRLAEHHRPRTKVEMRGLKLRGVACFELRMPLGAQKGPGGWATFYILNLRNLLYLLVVAICCDVVMLFEVILLLFVLSNLRNRSVSSVASRVASATLTSGRSRASRPT